MQITVRPLSFEQIPKLAKNTWFYSFKVDVQDNENSITEYTVSKSFTQVFDHVNWATIADPNCKIVTLNKPFFTPNTEAGRKQRHSEMTKSLQSTFSSTKITNSWPTCFFLGIPYPKSKIVGKKILIPLPSKDFDPSEFSIPFHALKISGAQITIATPSGNLPIAEPLVLDPNGVVFGQLGATLDAIQLYSEISQNADEFINNVISYDDIDPDNFDGLHLNGGHAPGMREYLESKLLQDIVVKMVEKEITVGAICHGSLLLARSKASNGKSIISSRKVTTLPYFMEKVAVSLTGWKIGNGYYQTYDTPCATEVESLLDNIDQFQRGPLSGTHGTLYSDINAWVVVDGNIISARYPGDAYLYAKKFIHSLSK